MHLSGVAKPAFAVVATHGLTDLDSIVWVCPYLAMTILPLSTESVTILFCAASIFHFSEDSTPLISLLLHILLLVTGLIFNIQTAFMTMLGYLTLVHVPSHYARCASRGRGRAAKWAFLVGCVAGTVGIFIPNVDIAFGDEVQRLIIAHVVVENEKR